MGPERSVYSRFAVPPDSFRSRVDDQIKRLTSLPLPDIEAQVTAKRRTWWDRRPLPGEAAATPRAAFDAFFFAYLGLASEDLTIVREDDDAIVWRSTNPCPTLEACTGWGLDTRVICRGAYEKSTQAFVSRIDPQLRFLRDYATIRPFAPYCQERIVRVPFKPLMRLAIEQARLSRTEGNKGYGAVIALGDEVIAVEHDTAVTDRDPSRHAEVNAIRAAVTGLRDGNLSGCVLFTTCEPCPMCSSLAVWANLTTVVYGASIATTAARGKARITIPAAEVIARSPALIEVIPGVLESECLDLY